MLHLAPLEPKDRQAWDVLAQGYREFYKTPTTTAEFDAAWARVMAGTECRGLGAKLDGQLVGFAHYLFHASTWAPSVCYLQDLFTAPEARGQGVARALIHEVAAQARQAGAQRYYWLTQTHNATARALYDQVAEHKGFIRYEYPI